MTINFMCHDSDGEGAIPLLFHVIIPNFHLHFHIWIGFLVHIHFLFLVSHDYLGARARSTHPSFFRKSREDGLSLEPAFVEPGLHEVQGYWSLACLYLLILVLHQKSSALPRQSLCLCYRSSSDRSGMCKESVGPSMRLGTQGTCGLDPWDLGSCPATAGSTYHE